MTYNTRTNHAKSLQMTRPNNVPRPYTVKRATSLPTKLEKAPPTKKLFWFRPTLIVEDEKENRPMGAVTFRPFKSTPSRPLAANVATEESSDELLLGLDFLDG